MFNQAHVCEHGTGSSATREGQGELSQEGWGLSLPSHPPRRDGCYSGKMLISPLKFGCQTMTKLGNQLGQTALRVLPVVLEFQNRQKKKEENAKATLLPSTALSGGLSNIFYSSQCSVFLFSLYLTLQVSQFPEEISAMFGPPAGQMFSLCSP